MLFFKLISIIILFIWVYIAMLSLRQTYLHRKIQRDIILSRHPITTEKFIKDCELDANIDNDTESFVLAVRNTISILAKIPSDLIVPNDIIERDIYVSHWLWEFNCAYFMETLENETNFDFDSKLLEKVHDPSMEPFITVKNLISDLLSVRELQSPIKTIR